MRLEILPFLIFGVGYVAGYGTFRVEIPNGLNVTHPCDDKDIWNGVGHINPSGGGDRNPFGIDFFQSGTTWTYDLCMKDSDGDGHTNGQELGDPNCVWTKGSIPMRTEDITHPGVCTPVFSSTCQGKNDWLNCQAEQFVCPQVQNPDVQSMVLTFPKTQIPAVDTTYMCMAFDIPHDQDYHMVAYKPEIDNVNVMHHILIYGCAENDEPVPTEPYNCNMGRGCNTIVGLWTLGGTGNCFGDDYGLKFGLTGFKRFVLEFHWTNPGMESNWYDSSGMTIYYTSNLRPNNGAVMVLGQQHLAIPPGKDSVVFSSTCSADCTAAALNSPIYVTGAANHMHLLGAAQSVEHWRDGRMARYITNEPEYDYANPQFSSFDPPIEVRPNDVFHTTCKYNSQYAKNWVYYGDATADEMCFAFLWFYPAEAMPEPYCTNWKSIEICAARTRPIVVDECNVYGFTYLYDQVGNALMTAVDKMCNLQGPCTDECKHAIMAAREHPCLRKGVAAEYVETLFYRSKEGFSFLTKMRMCDIKNEDYRTCSACHSTPTLLLVSLAALLAWK